MRMKIQQNARGQYTVTLPKPLVEALGWHKGKELAVDIMERGKIMLRERP
jgi:bifunctional DNA-binding transcriptional regulator/antitoxin component of YhaV-PrlF toxin-antitoxin module